ncbi:MAG: Arc family DNA-binding protein [Gemmatimonadales bacterium]|nr:Arc family DNA-binding protein [Gemmatimonadales bacterium]
MKALTIKGIPEPLYRQLKKTAVLHRRSINSEVLLCLERALLSRTVVPGELLARADAVRERIRVPRLTDAVLRTAKDAGRP